MKIDLYKSLRRNLIGFLLFFVLSAQSQANSAGSTFLEEELYPTWSRTFDQDSMKLWLMAAASVAYVAPQDHDIRDRWKDHQQLSKSNAQIGDILGTGIPGFAIVGAQYYFAQAQWRPHLRSIVYTGVWTYALKTVFARPRPGASENRQSFPSGHTSTAFATATSLTYAYGWKAAVLAYPVAVFVGLSRMSDDVHFASDVVGGAFLGVLATRAAHFDQHTNITIFPRISHQSSELIVHYSF